MRVRRRILFVSSNFPPVIGGSATVYDQICARLAQHIVALGSATSLWGQAWPDLARSDAERPYIMHRLPCLQPAESPERRARWRVLVDRVTSDTPIMARTLAYITWVILRYRVKVVCLGELVGLGWLVIPLRYLLGRRVIIYTHGEEITNESEWMLNRLRPLFLRHASAIVAVSSFCKGQIVARFNVSPARIQIVRNGVDLDVFLPGRPDRSGLPGAIRDRRIVLAVGRLVARKGQDQLLRAMPEVLARVPDAHCVIVGDGPLRTDIEQLIQELGLAAHCTLLAGISTKDLAILYRSCDVFVLPCHTLDNGDTEGFGLVFLEASACGAPVVAGAAGGTIEAVDHGKSGLLVDGRKCAEIADAIATILGEPVLARQLARGGIGWAAAHGWQRAVERFRGVCEESADVRPAYQPSAYASRGYAGPGEESLPALLVTVDVEEEFTWTEYRRGGYRVRGIDGLTTFHSFCLDCGVKPIYFLSWPIIQNEEFVRFFRGVLHEDSGEVGIHLHTWVTPPHWEEPNVFTSYQCNLPEHVERRKLEVLCRSFEDAFGRRPSIHRAGRWGGSERTSNLLAAEGICIDFSPVASDRDPERIAPDFSNLDGRPFWSGSDRNVLTIPLSAVKGIRGPDWMSRAYFRFRSAGYAERFEETSSLVAPIRFCPEAASAEILMSVAREIRKRRLPVAVFGLHSTSLYAQGNPYTKDEADAVAIRECALSVIRACLTEGIFVAARAVELHEALRNNPRQKEVVLAEAEAVPSSIS